MDVNKKSNKTLKLHVYRFNSITKSSKERFSKPLHIRHDTAESD